MTQLQEQQPPVAPPIKVKTRRRANSVAFACRTDYGLPDDDDDSVPKPLFLVPEPAERRRSAAEAAEGAKERDRATTVFTLS
ncbi:hypothetical protein X777_13451 [Ooceraea biroi]|uniref:Uncharacterized protein n=1 Tax=Ooceraea biroi TaxID=2015173 RepID=A0A026WWD2_OOCBI|nr:hypothetical protein X777_13451 [Ooceraea biroi]